MGLNKAFLNAISAENVELFEQLIFSHHSIFCDNLLHYLRRIIEVGNIEILHVLVDEWPFDKPIYIQEYMLSHIPYTSHSEDIKLAMHQCLMPYFYAEDPNRPGFYSFKDVFEDIVEFCMEKNFVVTNFYINTYYAEDYPNKLYPLIKKLEAAVDEPHHICILLHEDINNLMEYSDGYAYNLKKKHVVNVAATFLKLLLKDTRESMQLAVEVFQVLLTKDVHQIFQEAHFSGIMMQCAVHVEQVLSKPLVKKLVFQFIYNWINDDTEEKVYTIMSSWFGDTSDFSGLFNLSLSILNPFIGEPLRKKLSTKYIANFFKATPVKNCTFSLKELCRDVIRCKVYQNVGNTKEFMDRICEFKVPLMVTCFLLDIQDHSWMNNLQIV